MEDGLYCGKYVGGSKLRFWGGTKTSDGIERWPCLFFWDLVRNVREARFAYVKREGGEVYLGGMAKAARPLGGFWGSGRCT